VSLADTAHVQPLPIDVGIGDVCASIRNAILFVVQAHLLVMSATLIKSFVALVPSSMLFVGSIILFSKTKNVGSVLQLLGAGCLIVMILTHVAEALQLFPFMHWGQEHSIGHYFDLISAILGITLFPLGYPLHARGMRRARN